MKKNDKLKFANLNEIACNVVELIGCCSKEDLIIKKILCSNDVDVYSIIDKNGNCRYVLSDKE